MIVIETRHDGDERVGSRTPRVSLVLRWFLIALLGCLLERSLNASAGTARGRVTDTEGAPIEGVLVRVVAGADATQTNSQGVFDLALSLEAMPLALEVSHPGFVTTRLELHSVPATGFEIVVERRRSIVREEIAVSASRSQGNFSPQSTAASVLTPEASAARPNAVADLIAEAPGVSQNGQGGLFQTYSVRGVSRQRILTLVEGMRIVGERRAGVSASFLDPLLLGSIEVVRGPSSTYWGSGALGGVVQLFPSRFAALSIATGYSSEGDERFLRVGLGGHAPEAGWSLGVAAREAGLSETPGGEALFSGFEQLSTVFSRRWSSERTTYETLLIASRGDDIGKSSTEFPDRITTYPSETHGLFRFSASRPSGWRFEAYAHPNELETRVETPGEGVNEVDNRAFDWGLDLQRELRVSKRSTARWGVDLFARQDVRSRERTLDARGAFLREESTLTNASEREFGVYGAIETVFSGSRDQTAGAPAGAAKDSRGLGVTLLAGGRLAHQGQGDGDLRTTEDSAATAFVGLVAPLDRGYELTANLGSGLRFPSISERYFSGTTGRGTVAGNPGLEPESSVSADLGLRWTGSRVFLAASVFRSDIDGYIERIEIAPDRLTFVNLSSGRIDGIEWEGAWLASTGWSLSFGGHAMAGEEPDGQPLADVPADRLYAGWQFERQGAPERWTWRGRWERRFSKSDIGSGERPIPAADLVSSALLWRVRPELSLKFSARNLLDREYFNSADERVPLSPGRSLSLSIEWRPGGA